MIKHRIIEDVMAVSKNLNPQYPIINHLLILMKDSINFHLDDYNKKRLMVFPANKTFTVNWKFIDKNLPFNNVLITDDNNRVASLIFKEEGKIYCVRFQKRINSIKAPQLNNVWWVQRAMQSYDFEKNEQSTFYLDTSKDNLLMGPNLIEKKYETTENVLADRIGLSKEGAELCVGFLPSDIDFFQIYQQTVTLLSLLSCKNISTKEILPSEKLNKKRIKNNKLPIYSYKVLTYNPNALSNKYKSDNLNNPQYHVRLHFCRGHIKTYTEEKKLLGKHTGSFWWEPAMRGKNKDGFIDKDYLIK
jgi:hypothetical protein